MTLNFGEVLLNAMSAMFFNVYSTFFELDSSYYDDDDVPSFLKHPLLAEECN